MDYLLIVDNFLVIFVVDNWAFTYMSKVGHEYWALFDVSSLISMLMSDYVNV